MFVVRRMKCPLQLLLIVLAAFLASGCARLSATHKAATNPTSELPITIPTEEAIAFEHRVAALTHYALGLSLDLNGDPKAAFIQYSIALANDPDNEELTLDLARRLLHQGEKEQALGILENSAKRGKASGSVYTWLGLAYLQTGQTNAAVEANRTALKKSPENVAPYQNLALIYAQTGQTNEAVAILQEAARQKKAPADFLVALSELYLRFERDKLMPEKETREQVLELIDRAAALKPDNPLLLQRIGDFYFALGESRKAEPFYAQVLRDFPEAPGIREKLANIYLRSEQKEKASEVLESLRRARPTDPQNYYFLGGLAYDAKQYEKAAEYFETALKLNPDFEPLYYDLAGLRLNLRKPEEALALLEKARSKFKLNFTLEFYTGLVKAAQEKYSEALTHFTSAELLARTSQAEQLNHRFYFQLGATHERLGNIKESVAAFRKCLELSPDFADALNYLGYMWADRGENLEEAKTMIEKAVRLEPENAAFLDSMAWVLFKLNRAPEALEWMRKAIKESDKPDPTLFEHLGDIHAELKQLDEAREAWTKSLAAQPNDKVKEKLEKLSATVPSGGQR